MKQPKKVQKALDTIDKMVEYLHYYMGDSNEFKNLVRNDIHDLEELLKDLSIDRKVHNIRFAKKLKAIWEANENIDK